MAIVAPGTAVPCGVAANPAAVGSTVVWPQETMWSGSGEWTTLQGGVGLNQAAVIPPGWFPGATMAPTVQRSVVPAVPAVTWAAAPILNPQQPPRNFPGHFMPHRLCNHFTAHGWCRRAEACTFAHGLQELHPDVRAQLSGLGLPPDVVRGGKSKGKGKGPTVEAAEEVRKILGAMQTTMPVMMGNGACGQYSYFSQFADMNSFNLNAGAAEFVPVTGASFQGVPQEFLGGDDEDDGSENGGTTNQADAGSNTPSRRRPAPAPLTLDADMTPTTVAQFQSPTANVVVRPLSSPIHVQSTLVMRAPTGSTALMSPTGGHYFPTYSVASPTAALAPLPSPVRAPLPQPLASPVHVAITTGWPGSPQYLLSPMTKPPTPVPISRGTLLQGRTVAIHMEQGPPGLANFAPTPTTRAANLGFRYPHPGYMVTQPLYRR